MRSVSDLVGYVERMPLSMADDPVPVTPEEYLMLVNYYHNQQKTPVLSRQRINNMRLLGHPLEVLR